MVSSLLVLELTGDILIAKSVKKVVSHGIKRIKDINKHTQFKIKNRLAIFFFNSIL